MTQNLRLNRYLAQQGVSSRRKADQLIAQGHVEIDGEIVTELGTRVDPRRHKVSVDGIPLNKKSPRPIYLILNKPRNVVTTLSDPEGRPTIRDYLPTEPRLFPVGRLDYDADGLILITNDGDLAHRLMHPRYEVPRTYLVKVDGKPEAATLALLRRGVKLEDGFVRPDSLTFVRHTKEHSWYRLTVAEGRTHLVKRLWLRAGHSVRKLTRISFGSLTLGDLPVGRTRPLTRRELEKLQGFVQGE